MLCRIQVFNLSMEADSSSERPGMLNKAALQNYDYGGNAPQAAATIQRTKARAN